MQAHVGDATALKEACRALEGIAATGGAERATVVASVSGFTALVNATGAHPDDMFCRARGPREDDAIEEEVQEGRTKRSDEG